LTTHLYSSILHTPLGVLLIRANADNVLSVSFADEEPVSEFSENIISKTCKDQLAEYFDSGRTDFDLPLLLNGTEFQNKVWGTLQKIPAGKTISYLQLAKNLGDPKCIRAAGTANGKNPFAIIVPCHRVIGSNGRLIGYAGGLWRKQWLLEQEHKLVNGAALLF
jgi:methylated-DNA-[protein]-cysteine S-methyltransferase